MTTVLNVELKLTKEEKEKIVNECLDILNDRLVEELEEIKAEIDEIVEREWEESQLWSLGLRHSKKIIDNHIKELKGESKE